MSLHDPVANVAGRLQVQLSTRTLEKARSALRGLVFQNPHGSFGKGDNDWKRASALLEYIAREEEGVSIPLKQLAKAAYAKEADFVKFHRQVGHFRQTPISSNEGASSSTRQVLRRATENTNPLSTTSTATSSIPSLAMKLGSYVNDSNGVAMRAQRLWNQLIRSSQNNPDQLKDMTRFFKVYEAVCFFIQATRDTRTEEDDDGKRLQPKTVVEACTDFTLADFTSVLAHVQSLLDSTEACNGISSLSSAAARTSNGTSAKESSGKIKGSTNKHRKLASTEIAEKESRSIAGSRLGPNTNNKVGVEAVLKRANTLENLDDNPFGYTFTEPLDTSFSPRFLQWKQQTLDQAIQSATLAWERDHAGETSTRIQLLEIAAQNILESCGLLPRTN